MAGRCSRRRRDPARNRRLRPRLRLHRLARRSDAPAPGDRTKHCRRTPSHQGALRAGVKLLGLYPEVRTAMNESHPRRGGPPWVRYRREAEDVLCEAGAAILHLPDFYGPHVHVSTLQNALNEAASGKTVNWLGSADTQREYIYVPERHA